MNKVLTSAVTVIVVDGPNGTVNRKTFKVGIAVAVDLSIQIGENPPLKQWVLGEVNATYDVTRLKLTRCQIESFLNMPRY